MSNTTYFYPRDGILQCRLTVSRGVYRRLSTGIKIPKHLHFNKNQQVFSGSSSQAKELNVLLKEQRVLILEAAKAENVTNKYKEVRQYYDEAKIFDAKDTQLVALGTRYIQMAANGIVKTKRKTMVQPASLNNYRYSLRILTEYNRPLDLMDFNMASNISLESKRMLTVQWRSYFQGFVEMMDANSLSQNTQYSVLSCIHIFISYWAKELYLQLPKVDVVQAYAPPIVVLPSNFIREFLNDTHKKYDKFTSRYKYLWELFATIMVTTLRIGDAMKLNAKDVHFESNSAYLRKFNKKTGAETFIPLPPKLAEVYGRNMQNHRHLYSMSGYTQLEVYRYCEEFFAQYDELQEMHSVTRLLPDGQEEVINKPMYEWTKPHMLRKTAITSMLANGVKEEHVKFASGHAYNSQAFERYKGFVERKFKSEINDYYDKFLNIKS